MNTDVVGRVTTQNEHFEGPTHSYGARAPSSYYHASLESSSGGLLDWVQIERALDSAQWLSARQTTL